VRPARSIPAGGILWIRTSRVQNALSKAAESTVDVRLRPVQSVGKIILLAITMCRYDS
jgi:hypothetical protein